MMKLLCVVLCVVFAFCRADENFSICDNKCGVAVQGKSVKIVVKSTNNSSAYEAQSPYLRQLTISLAMRNLVAITNGTDQPFTFTTKFFKPYGDFVTAINGVAPGENQFWKLNVNGKMSQCGIDTYILKSGDVVQWSLDTIHGNDHE